MRNNEHCVVLFIDRLLPGVAHGGTVVRFSP